MSQRSLQKEKAELFNSYFCSVFRPTKSVINSDVSTSSMLTSTPLSNITVSEEEFLHHLLSLDPPKAFIPDGIPGRVLKESSSVIAPKFFAYFSTTLLNLEFYPQNGNLLTLLQSIKMGRKNQLLTTDQYLCFPLLAKSWSDVFALGFTIMFGVWSITLSTDSFMDDHV